jgi:hypothetical protein
MIIWAGHVARMVRRGVNIVFFCGKTIKENPRKISARDDNIKMDLKETS